MKNKLNEKHHDEIWICSAGIVSALGLDLDTVGARLEQGQSAVKVQNQFNADMFTNTLAAQVETFKANAYVKQRKNLKLMSRSVRLGLGAIRLATDQYGLESAQIDPDRLGVVVGAGVALGQSRDLIAGIKQSFVNDTFSSEKFGEVGMRAINPLWLLKGLSNNVLGFATAELDARGFNQNYCNSGIAGLQAIGEAFWALRERRADVLVAGGSDSAVDPFHFAGFSRLRALSAATSATEVRPFDERRDGFVLGEGAAYFVLERANDARKNERTGLARILSTATATCSEQPLESDPKVLAQCISRCIKSGNLSPGDVGGIIAHGNGSRRFDLVEARAIELVFGDGCPPVTTNKAQLGHTIAASGPLSLACGLYAGKVGKLPAIPTLKDVAPDCSGINLVKDGSATLTTPVLLVITAGLGGQLSCLLMEVF